MNIFYEIVLVLIFIELFYIYKVKKDKEVTTSGLVEIKIFSVVKVVVFWLICAGITATIGQSEENYALPFDMTPGFDFWGTHINTMLIGGIVIVILYILWHVFMNLNIKLARNINKKRK